MTKRTKKQLLDDLAKAKSDAAHWEKAWGEERQKRADSDAALKDSRSHFADLKERLHNVETELARLRGYMDRVHEDDIVRDGMVEIEDANGKRLVPKRQPPMQHHTTENFALQRYGSEKRTHWTSY